MAYKVMVQKTWSDRITEWIVTDQPKDWDDEGRVWLPVAKFPVGNGKSADDQRRRAYEYCDYMNRTTPVQPPIGDA